MTLRGADASPSRAPSRTRVLPSSTTTTQCSHRARACGVPRPHHPTSPTCTPTTQEAGTPRTQTGGTTRFAPNGYYLLLPLPL
jgi:hypothetical protein